MVSQAGKPIDMAEMECKPGNCIQVWTGYEGNSTKYMLKGV